MSEPEGYTVNEERADHNAPESAAEVEASPWQETFGIAGNPSFDKFDSPEALAKSYSELEKSMSHRVAMPTEDASDERIQAFREKVLAADDNLMLRPDGYTPPPAEAGAYEFEEVEGANVPGEDVGAFKAVAHELGLTNAQASGVHKFLASNIAESQSGINEMNNKGMSELQGQWGQATKHKMEQARNTVALLGDRVPGLSNMLDSLANIGHDATGIRLMDAITEMMGEAGAVQPTHRSQLTPEEASHQLFELREKYGHLEEGSIGWEQYRAKEVALRKAGGRLSVQMGEAY